MIDVSKHIQRLEWLKEWMVYFVDGHRKFIVNGSALTPVIRDVQWHIDLFFKVGWFISERGVEETLQISSFDDFVKFKEKTT